MGRLKLTLFAAIGALLLALPAVGQNLGDQDYAPSSAIQVNTTTALADTNPAIDIDADGNYVVAWRQFSSSIYVRRFDSNLNPLGAPLQANNNTDGTSSDPDICVDDDGNFVVTWKRIPCCTADEIVLRRRVGETWSPQFDDESASTFHPVGSVRNEPAIACQDAGDFIVTWRGETNSDQDAIVAREYILGVGQGNEFRVNTVTTDPNLAPKIAMDGAGDFVIAWGQSDTDVDPRTATAPGTAPRGPIAGITTRRYLADATPLDTDQQLLFAHTGSLFSVDVSRQDSIGGDYAVVWEDSTANATAKLRRYTADGTEIGDTTFVPAGSYSGEIQPIGVFAGDNGEFLLATTGPDGSPPVEYQRYDDPLTEHGSPWLGPGGAGRLSGHDMVARSDGGMAIVWSDGTEIYVQQWIPALFADGFESGDTSEW